MSVFDRERERERETETERMCERERESVVYFNHMLAHAFTMVENNKKPCKAHEDSK